MKGSRLWHPGMIAGVYLLALFATVGAMFRWPFHWALLGLLYGLLILFFSFAFLVIVLTFGFIFASIGARLKTRWRGPLGWGELTPKTVTLADLLPRRFRWLAKRGARQAPLWDHWLDGH